MMLDLLVVCVRLQRRLCLVVLRRRVWVTVLRMLVDILVSRLCLRWEQHLTSILVRLVILLWCRLGMWCRLKLGRFVRRGATPVWCAARNLCILDWPLMVLIAAWMLWLRDVSLAYSMGAILRACVGVLRRGYEARSR